MNEDLIELCSDLTPIDGDIVTAASEVMGIIKFKGTICFMGVRIDCLVADIIQLLSHLDKLRWKTALNGLSDLTSKEKSRLQRTALLSR